MGRHAVPGDNTNELPQVPPGTPREIHRPVTLPAVPQLPPIPQLPVLPAPVQAPLLERPRPLLAAFRSVGSTIALAGGLVTTLAGYGVFSAVQGDALTGLLGAIPGAIAIGTGLLAAFGVVKVAEKDVTPNSDPMTVDGQALVPAGD